jgi:hypothetical protein
MAVCIRASGFIALRAGIPKAGFAPCLGWEKGPLITQITQIIQILLGTISVISVAFWRNQCNQWTFEK